MDSMQVGGDMEGGMGTQHTPLRAEWKGVPHLPFSEEYQGAGADPFQSFDHNMPFGEKQDGPVWDLCWDFVHKGYCPRGNQCRWSHDGPMGGMPMGGMGWGEEGMNGMAPFSEFGGCPPSNEPYNYDESELPAENEAFEMYPYDEAEFEAAMMAPQNSGQWAGVQESGDQEEEAWGSLNHGQAVQPPAEVEEEEEEAEEDEAPAAAAEEDEEAEEDDEDADGEEEDEEPAPAPAPAAKKPEPKIESKAAVADDDDDADLSPLEKAERAQQKAIQAAKARSAAADAERKRKAAELAAAEKKREAEKKAAPAKDNESDAGSVEGDAWSD